MRQACTLLGLATLLVLSEAVLDLSLRCVTLPAAAVPPVRQQELKVPMHCSTRQPGRWQQPVRSVAGAGHAHARVLLQEPAQDVRHREFGCAARLMPLRRMPWQISCQVAWSSCIVTHCPHNMHEAMQPKPLAVQE